MTINRGGSYPERIIPDETPAGIVALHLARYDFAAQWTADRRVLDVACGVGYGSRHLAGTASFVLGGDLSVDAIGYARAHYGRLPNLAFAVMDAMHIGMPSGSMDVVCSFETIEHLPDPKEFLAEVRRVLGLDGIFIASTPNASHTTDQPDNPFHRQEWSPVDFEKMLRRYFGEVVLYGQRRRQTRLHAFLQRADLFKLRARLMPAWLVQTGARATGTMSMAELTLDDVIITEGEISRATEIVVVCRRPRHFLRQSV